MCVNVKFVLVIRVRVSKDNDCRYEIFYGIYLYVINLVFFKSVLKLVLVVMYLFLMYFLNFFCFFCKKIIKLEKNLLILKLVLIIY